MLGTRIKVLREAKGYTQQELADLMGVSKQQVYRWEVGKSEDASGESLTRLAEIFSVTTDYLLGYSDTPFVVESNLSPMEQRLIYAARKGSIVEALEVLIAMSKQAS